MYHRENPQTTGGQYHQPATYEGKSCHRAGSMWATYASTRDPEGWAGTPGGGPYAVCAGTHGQQRGLATAKIA